jgi:hypothetical protein
LKAALGDLRQTFIALAIASPGADPLPDSGLAGDRDPMTPMAFSETIVANLPEHLVRFERFSGCGHGVTDDDPVRAFGVIKDFLQS